MSPPVRNFDERFDEIFEMARGNPDDCWDWPKDRMSSGYGRMWRRLGLKNWECVGAHRHSLIVATGGDRPGFDACHSCDNPACVNPAHLFWGSRTDNMRDAKAKGRTRNKPFPTGDKHPFRKSPEMIKRGVRVHNSKLTEQQVREIYELARAGKTDNEIGATLNLNRGTVYAISSGRGWRHMHGVNGNPTTKELEVLRPRRRHAAPRTSKLAATV